MHTKVSILSSAVEFESAEFSRAHCVRSADRKFAYDTCHPGMIEYLLDHRGMSLRICAQHLVLSFDRRLRADEIPQSLQQLVEIRKLMPKYLFDARSEGT